MAMSPCVERVVNVLPQAHVTRAGGYSGWMPSFMAGRAT
jgi:hypothetical protein